jgi:drug/metabolite transporter (DMT)-like permease
MTAVHAEHIDTPITTPSHTTSVVVSPDPISPNVPFAAAPPTIGSTVKVFDGNYDDFAATGFTSSRRQHWELIKTHSALCMSQAPFGVYVVLARGALSDIPAHVLLFLRLAFGFLTLITFQITIQRRNPVRHFLTEMPPALRRNVIASGLATSLGPLLFMWGLHYTPAIVAAAIDASSPAVAVVIALSLRLDTFKAFHAVCIVLSLAGNYWVLDLAKFLRGPISRRESVSRHQELIGVLAVLASVFCVVGNFYMQRPLLRVLRPEDLTTLIAFVGLLTIALVSLHDLSAFSTLWNTQHDSVTVAMLAYACLLQGWSHNYFGAVAVKRSSPMLVSMYTSLVPAISATLGYFWLGERVRFGQAFGVLVVVSSVILSAYYHEHRRRKGLRDSDDDAAIRSDAVTNPKGLG